MKGQEKEGGGAKWSTKGAGGGVSPEVPINFRGAAITPYWCTLFLFKSQAT